MLFNSTFLLRTDVSVELKYLYAKLRFFAKDRSGFIDRYDFTVREKYDKLPQLIKLRLVTPDGKRIVHHRRATKSGEWNITYSKVKDSDIESKDAFRGMLIALAEEKLIRHSIYKKKHEEALAKIDSGESRLDLDDVSDKFCRNLRLKDRRKLTELEKRTLESKSEYYGIKAQAVIANVLGISVATLKRWRKHSPNRYRTLYHDLEGDFTIRASKFSDTVKKQVFDTCVESGLRVDWKKFDNRESGEIYKVYRFLESIIKDGVKNKGFVMNKEDFGYYVKLKRTEIAGEKRLSYPKKDKRKSNIIKRAKNPWSKADEKWGV